MTLDEKIKQNSKRLHEIAMQPTITTDEFVESEHLFSENRMLREKRYKEVIKWTDILLT